MKKEDHYFVSLNLPCCLPYQIKKKHLNFKSQHSFMEVMYIIYQVRICTLEFISRKIFLLFMYDSCLQIWTFTFALMVFYTGAPTGHDL